MRDDGLTTEYRQESKPRRKNIAKTLFTRFFINIKENITNKISNIPIPVVSSPAGGSLRESSYGSKARGHYSHVPAG